MVGQVDRCTRCHAVVRTARARHPATKFDAPRSRPEHLSRNRQLAAIDPHARVLLVAAPAGYGKTTLVGQWLNRDRERPATAWIQLAPEDDGLFAFWIAVVSGVAGACAAVGRRSLGALAAPLVDVQSAVLAPLIDELWTFGGAVDLVLDDLHLVCDPAAHETLGWFVEHAPANLRIAIATRHAPALGLGRLRARGELTELRTADLRFDGDDARRFLNERHGLALDDADVDALMRRTEGWPAGLYLAALSLRGVADQSAFIAAFAGDDELIVDYLRPELLRGLDDATRRFLRRTSILESFCAPLCDAVAGTDGSADEVLRELQRTNLFVVALDRRRRWFRYERLFAELLRAERIDALVTVPTMLAATPEADLRALRTVFVGGEALPRSVARRWGAERELVNVYGPTETTIFCTLTPPLDGDGEPPIGAP
ncbi:MAG: AMP-binding protein, partial [Actinobacteria bacterium]|nr:AMP-binding protein [Actinomycetota bacterium]